MDTGWTGLHQSHNTNESITTVTGPTRNTWDTNWLSFPIWLSFFLTLLIFLISSLLDILRIKRDGSNDEMNEYYGWVWISAGPEGGYQGK